MNKKEKSENLRMKKISCILAAILMLSGALPYLADNASAYTNSYGTISYNSATNTITITGNSSDGDAWKFYDFWYWANVDPATYPNLVNSSDATATHEGTQYTFYCKLQDGDGTTETYFADENKQIMFNVSASNGEHIITVKANAHFQLGEVVNEAIKLTRRGCFIYFSCSPATWVVAIYNSGDTSIYSSTFAPLETFTTNSVPYIYYLDGNMWHSQVGTLAYVKDTTNLYDVVCTRYFQQPFGIPTSEYLFVKEISAWGSSSAQKILKFNKLIYMGNYIGFADYVTAYLIDPDLPDGYTVSMLTHSYLYLQYTFNPIITYVNGSPVAYAHVILKDRYNNTIIDDYTDSDGRILNGTEPYIVTYAFYNHTGGNTPYLQGPHHLIIAKDGFASYSANITIDHPVIDDAFVLDSLTYTYDDIMNFLQQKWGNYNASQFWNYLQTIDANLTDVYNLLQLTDGNLTDVMNLLQLVDGNITQIYDLLQMVNLNVTNTNTTLNAVYYLLQQVNSNLTNVNLTLNDAYNLLKLTDNNVTAVYNLLVSTDGNVTETYNLLKQINTNITSISNKLDIINSTVHNNYALLNEINTTTHATLNKWANITAQQLSDLEQQTNSIAHYINTTRWGTYDFSDIMSKWGSYSASSLYDISDQAAEIADYINSTRWNTYVASQLYDISNQAYQAANDAKSKWGSYSASDLYSISQNILSLSQEIKNIVIHVNTTVSEQHGFRIELTDFGRLKAGNTYYAQLTVFDANGSMIDADSNPTMKLYDANGNLVTNGSMTKAETGRYTFECTTSSGQPGGTWTAMASTTVSGETVKNIDYWELITNPAKITIDVVDDVPPDITAKLEITNEGNTSQEYTYYYWITPRIDGEIGDNDTIDSASASKLIDPGETYTTYVTLTCNDDGDYYYRARVYYGSEYSEAYQEFNTSSGSSNWIVVSDTTPYLWYSIAILVLAIIVVMAFSNRRRRKR